MKSFALMFTLTTILAAFIAESASARPIDSIGTPDAVYVLTRPR